MKRTEEGGCMGLRRGNHVNAHGEEACSLFIRWTETECTQHYTTGPPTLQGMKRETHSAPAV